MTDRNIESNDREIPDNAPKYEMIEFRGQPARLYPNGDIRNEKGHLLTRPERIKDMTITPENTQSFKNRRKEKMLEAIEAGVMKATDAPDPAAAVMEIIARKAKVAMNDDGRVGNEATRIILDALDAYQDKKHENVQVQRHEYVVDEKTQRMLLEIMSHRTPLEIIDAE